MSRRPMDAPGTEAPSPSPADAAEERPGPNGGRRPLFDRLFAGSGVAFETVAWVVVGLGAVVTLVNWVAGPASYRHAAMGASVAGAGLALIVAVRRRHLTPAMGSHAIVGISLLVVVAAVRARTGITAPATAWLTVVCVVAMMLLGERQSRAWWIVTELAWVYLGVVEDASAWDPRRGPIPVYVIIRMLALGGVYFVVAAFQRNRLRVVDELEEARRQEEAARQRAEILARSRTTLLARMSHEIRTPMNGILGIAEILHSEELPGEHGEHVEILRRAGRNLLRILDDVLEFSKLDAERIRYEHEPVAPRVLVSRVRGLLMPNAQVKGLTLSSDIADDVPEWVEGDALRIQQVLINLVSNALKFTKEGEVRISVAVKSDAQPSRERLRFEVRDTGSGIAHDQLEAIFDPFQQAEDSTARFYGGTGLGLSICRGLVEGMGGTMEVSSELGAGSMFGFDLPLEEPRLLERSGEDSVEFPVPRRSLVGRVLLVDDDPDNRSIGELMLGKLGIECELVDGGADAIDRRFDREVDLILMDCQMPGIDGYRASAAIRAREIEEGRPRLPIVALSASTLDDDRRRCIEVGMDAFLAKPLTLDGLADALRPWLEGRAGVNR